MRKNSLIIIPSYLPLDFPADYIKQTAKALIKNNHMIIYNCYGDATSQSYISYWVRFKKKRKIFSKQNNITIYTPLHIFPLVRFNAIKIINTWIDLLLLFFILFITKRISIKTKRILWTFQPESAAFIPCFKLFAITLYDCVDYYRGVPHYQLKKSSEEDRLIKSV